MTEAELQRLIDNTAAAIRDLSKLLQDAHAEGVRFEMNYEISHLETGITTRTGFISKLTQTSIKQVKIYTETPSP